MPDPKHEQAAPPVEPPAEPQAPEPAPDTSWATTETIRKAEDPPGYATKDQPGGS